MNAKPYMMVVVLTIIAIISSLILATVNNATKVKIAEAYRKDFLKGLQVVLPEFDNEPDREFKDVDGRKIYLAKIKGSLKGYAIKITTPKGYSGNIVVLVGVGLNGKISGIQILQHAETPGLGNKIEFPEWRDSFKNLSLKDKIFVKKDDGLIDQFSGATISPRAVCEAVREGLEFINTKVIGGEK